MKTNILSKGSDARVALKVISVIRVCEVDKLKSALKRLRMNQELELMELEQGLWNCKERGK